VGFAEVVGRGLRKAFEDQGPEIGVPSGVDDGFVGEYGVGGATKRKKQRNE
jgi:hypothetical protein